VEVAAITTIAVTAIAVAVAASFFRTVDTSKTAETISHPS
jgi:hypothetical protein